MIFLKYKNFDQALNKTISPLLWIDYQFISEAVMILVFALCSRKRQSNAAAAVNNIDDVKTFTVPCNVDVHLTKATVNFSSTIFHRFEFTLPTKNVQVYEHSSGTQDQLQRLLC